MPNFYRALNLERARSNLVPTYSNGLAEFGTGLRLTGVVAVVK
jgi:hypothetical protein